MDGKGTIGDKCMMGAGMMSSEKKAAAKVTDSVCAWRWILGPSGRPTDPSLLLEVTVHVDDEVDGA